MFQTCVDTTLNRLISQKIFQMDATVMNKTITNITKRIRCFTDKPNPQQKN